MLRIIVALICAVSLVGCAPAFAYTNQSVKIHNEVAQEQFMSKGGYVDLDIKILSSEANFSYANEPYRNNTVYALEDGSYVTEMQAIEIQQKNQRNFNPGALIPAIDYPERIPEPEPVEEKQISWYGKTDEFHGEVVRHPFGTVRVQKHTGSRVTTYKLLKGRKR